MTEIQHAPSAPARRAQLSRSALLPAFEPSAVAPAEAGRFGVPRYPSHPRIELGLLGGFEFHVDDAPVPLPLSAQRVVAFLALHDRPVQRSFVAGSLWTDVSEERASANLRSALWRVRAHAPSVVDAIASGLRLDGDTAVDVRTLIEESRHLPDRSTTDAGNLILWFERDLLPDWYDDWALEWRERWRQIRLHSLDSLMRMLAANGRYGEAIDAGLAAVRTEPLWESAHRGLIETHLMEGNPEEARRQFRAYAQLLRQELGASPSARMAELAARLDMVQDLRPLRER